MGRAVESGLARRGEIAVRRLGVDEKSFRKGHRYVSVLSDADKGHVIEVDDPYHFNEGATIRITDGLTTETGLVVGVQRGALKLDRGVSSDYHAYEAVVSVVAPRPVNVNTAPPEVLLLLLEGLKVRGRNERITGGEAGTIGLKQCLAFFCECQLGILFGPGALADFPGMALIGAETLPAWREAFEAKSGSLGIPTACLPRGAFFTLHQSAGAFIDLFKKVP